MKNMKTKLESLIDKDRLPNHIAIIMDGNGRWAEKKNVERIRGYEEGIKSARAVARACEELGVRNLTLYVFSVQNWKRPADEVRFLMEMLKQYLLNERDSLIKNDIRLNAIGRTHELPPDVHKALTDTIKETGHCQLMNLTLALSYGGREEIIDAAKQIATDDKINIEDIDQATFSRFLYAHDLPELDLLIRTSGEMRLSNFLLWQIAYAEIYVTRTLWPDFRKRHLVKAILNYQRRERRFGLIGEQARKVRIKF